MQRSVAAEADRFIVASRRVLSTLDAQLRDETLAWDYKNFVYGGRRHRLGHWIDRPHLGLMKLHEACKALFCPTCRLCGKHHLHCRCTQQQICWTHVGQAPVRAEAGGEGEDAIRHCPDHGPYPWRKCLMYSTVAVFPGNRWAKEVPVDTPVLTPTGWVEIGRLRVGDRVLAGDGTPTEVVGVFPQGVKPIWRLTFDDGASCLAGEYHQWKIKTPAARFRKKHQSYGKWAVANTREILRFAGEDPKPGRRCSIPLAGAAAHEARPMLVDPYLLGLLIGDGGLSGESVNFTTADDMTEAAKRVVGLAANGGGQ